MTSSTADRPTSTDLLVAAATFRLPWLLFSVPYIWLWTGGLGLGHRVAASACHAFVVLAVGCWNDVADVAQWTPLHLGVVRDRVRISPELARSAAPVMAGLAIAASLPLASVYPYAPFAVTVVLAVAWYVTRLPARQKYLAIPELLGPAVALALPGLALLNLEPAQPPWLTILAGTGFAAALVLAMHLRDRDTDAAAGILTVARRFPESTARWMWVCGVTGAVAATATIYRPLALADQLAIVGVGGFLIALLLPGRGRVAAMSATHAVYACSLLL